MSTLAPPWIEAEAGTHESKAEEIERAIEALERIQPLYVGQVAARHSMRSFIDNLKVDAHNAREQAKRVRARAA
jgi:hypothetical protein